MSLPGDEMRYRFMRNAALAILPLLVITTTSAQPQSFPPVVYHLQEEGSLQEGCFPPCLCPLLQAASVRGTFKLLFRGIEDGTKLFEVRDVKWSVPALDRWLTGSGTFRIGTRSEPFQQLVLDLQTNDGPVERFDSGLVPVAEPFPRISTLISIHGLQCFDTAIDVRARPARPVPFILRSGESEIGWETAPGAAGYDVVWGWLKRLHDLNGDFTAATEACLADDFPGTSLTYSIDPPAGTGVWFVARAVDAVNGNTYESNDPLQIGSRDLEIDASVYSCP